MSHERSGRDVRSSASFCDGKRGTEVSDSCRTAGPSSRSADKQDKTSQHDMTGRKRGAKQQQKRRQGDEDWISVT